MTAYHAIRWRRRRAASGPRVGLFGNLGSGNLGNDGSVEVVVAYLIQRHPDAELGFFCMGPEQVMARYGVPATHLQWYEAHGEPMTGAPATALKAIGRIFDAFRTLAWVRRHDVVIVPGMGVLEATVPLRPWGFPYALFCLSAAGRLVGTRIALVSVGAEVVQKRATRWLIRRAARLAHYRSYRDAHSRNAMRQMGIDVAGDEVYPDLAFGLPVPVARPGATGAVGVGVMEYCGGNDDRERAGELRDAYLDTMKRFVRWLVDDGRLVRLFTGDQADAGVVAEIIADLRAHRPDLGPSRVVFEPASTLQDLMRQMAAVDTVVATRYHNVVSALRLSKPTLSISYAAKNDVLMADMGLGEFCQSARSVDFDRLIEQFTALEGRSDEVTRIVAERNRVAGHRLARQFTDLSAALFPAPDPAAVPAVR